MEVKFNDIINGLGLYATKNYKMNDIIYKLTGLEYTSPLRETIYIGDNKHIFDEYGKFINHSFNPSIYVNKYDLIALHDIKIGDEITFNYNDNEINMASPFYVDNILVSGSNNFL